MLRDTWTANGENDAREVNTSPIVTESSCEFFTLSPESCARVRDTGTSSNVTFAPMTLRSSQELLALFERRLTCSPMCLQGGASAHSSRGEGEMHILLVMGITYWVLHLPSLALFSQHRARKERP